MLNQPTIEKLQLMKLHGMADAFREQIETADSSQLSFEERFGLLVDRQWTWKEGRALTRRLQQYGNRLDRPHPEPLHDAGPAQRGACGLRERDPVGGAGPADHPGHGRPPGGDRRREREARSAVHRTVRPGHPHGEALERPVRRLPSPCERRPGDEGLFRAHARSGPPRGSTGRLPPLWITLWTTCGPRLKRCGPRRVARCTRLWVTRPGYSVAGV